MEQDVKHQIAKRRAQEWFVLFMQRIELKQGSTDRFNNLLIQIGSVILALVGTFGTSFVIDESGWVAKVLFFSGLMFLVASLIMGLVNAMHGADLWDKATTDYQACFRKWREAREGRISDAEAQQYCDGITKGTDKESSAKWPWLWQLRCLAIGIVLLLAVVFVVLL